MFIKIHVSNDANLLAICDEDLLGKTLEEGEKYLCVYEHFYGGEIKSEKEIKALLKEFNNVNVVGKGIVKIMLDLGLIEKEDIIYIGGVAHACISTC